MTPIPADVFLRWAAGVGVGFDPRYPDSGSLALLPVRDHDRFWVLPDGPAVWPDFVDVLLGGLDDYAVGYLWPREGRWPGQGGNLAEAVRGVILRGAGVPLGWAGAVRVEPGETDALVAVLYASLAFGWCIEDDLFFVPDHGRQVLQTSHHDVVHVECETEERVRQLVAHMAAARFDLPTEPPDATFKWPAWMARPTGNTA